MLFLLKYTAAIILLWLGSMFAVTAVHEAASLPGGHICIAFAISFIVGIFIFKKYKFPAVYVFGHEMTHYLTAKLFLKKTGRIRLGSKSGSVEVMGSNIWIVLAPYIVPFYTIAAVSIYGLAICFYKSQWLDMVLACITAVGYAYHVMLTLHVLHLNQTDLLEYGPFFSIAVIFAGNMMLVLLSVLIFTGTWKDSVRYFIEITLVQKSLFFTALELLQR